MEKGDRKTVERRVWVWEQQSASLVIIVRYRGASQVNYSSTKSRKTAIQRIRFLSGQLSCSPATQVHSSCAHVHARHTRRLA